MVELDVSVFRFIHHAFSGGWLVPMAVLSAIGGGWGSLAVVPLVATQRTRRFAVSLAAVLGATAVLVFLFKRLFARARPCVCLADAKALVFDAPTDFSFPSGHSAGSFAFAIFVALVLVRTSPPHATIGEHILRRAGAALLMLVAVGIGLSRIALGVHFPADVVAGAILGATIAALGSELHLRARRPMTDVASSAVRSEPS